MSLILNPKHCQKNLNLGGNWIGMTSSGGKKYARLVEERSDRTASEAIKQFTDDNCEIGVFLQLLKAKFPADPFARDCVG